MISTMLGWPRRVKNLVAVFVDSVCLVFAYWFAQSVRFEQIYFTTNTTEYLAVGVTVLTSVILFRQLKLYRSIIRYVGLQALIAIGSGVALSAFVLYLTRVLFGAPIPLASIIIYALLSAVMVGGSRMAFRIRYQRLFNRDKERVIIYGAGASGRQLALSLYNGAEYQPVCFVDDDTSLQGSMIQGLTVRTPDELKKQIQENEVESILLAMPSASNSQRKSVLEVLEDLPVKVRTIPGISDLVSGKASIDELSEVQVEDLLGRDPVPPLEALLDRDIRGKSVLVTGAGGSIGSELCRQIIRRGPSRVVLLDITEYALYTIDKELRSLMNDLGILVDIVPVIGAVQREKEALRAMTEHKVQTVYHAAAYKHVPLLESNVVEAVYNNVLGTWSVAQAAVDSGVEKFVLVSTDKAVRPTNVMGATKRLAELVLQAMAKRTHKTRFCMVRFGNVLGSSGSVVPIFREQIKKGGPVTVTARDMTRYFMTIPEAAMLVIQAGAMSQNGDTNGGEVYVLDMGEPIRIVDLARKMIHLMGMRVKNSGDDSTGIEIQYTGLRPGEKLYEELLIGKETSATDHPRIMKAAEVSLNWNETNKLLHALKKASETGNTEAVFDLLLQAPVDFQPNVDISEVLTRAKAGNPG